MDMIVKLFDLADDWSFMKDMADKHVIVRKPLGSEIHYICQWIRERFGNAWASEADLAMTRLPSACFVAVDQDSLNLLGFSCYDTAALGYFGPTGVIESSRGRGIGKALLLAALLDMKLKGYGCAIIGYVGPVDFYKKAVGATEIPDSTPGLWKTWIHPTPAKQDTPKA